MYAIVTVVLRPFASDDWPDVWAVIAPVLRAGETYAYSPSISEDEAYAAWITMPLATVVAVDAQGRCLGTYYLKP